MQTVMDFMIVASSHVVCLSDKLNNANVVRLWKKLDCQFYGIAKNQKILQKFHKNCIFIVNEGKVDYFYVVQSFWGGGGEGPSYLHGRHAPGALLALLWPTVAPPPNFSRRGRRARYTPGGTTNTNLRKCNINSNIDGGNQ